MANRVQTRAAKGELAGEVTEAPVMVGDKLDLATEIEKLSEAIRQAITDGHVVARMNEVTRTVKGKKYGKEYLQLVPVNYPGMQAIGGGIETTWGKDEKGDGFDFQGPCIVKDFFYGNDLGVKSKESQRIAILVEGPDTAKAAAAKQLAKAFGITVEEAMEKINAMQ